MKTYFLKGAGFAGFSAALILLCTSAPVRSQQPSQAQLNAIRQACRGDYQTYCSSVPTGGKAALACLQQNAASLSPPCQNAVGAIGGHPATQSTPVSPQPNMPEQRPPASMREEAALIRRACGADYRRLCRGIRPGEGRGIACLRDNEASLSSPCQHALMSASQSR